MICFCVVHKSKKTVLSMNIQTDVDLETPDNQAALMEQVYRVYVP